MGSDQNTAAGDLPKPELIGHLPSNESVLLTFCMADGRRFAAVAVIGEGESKPVAERTLVAAGDLAVHVDHLGGDIGKRVASSTSSTSRILREPESARAQR